MSEKPVLRFVLGDQLSRQVSSLSDADPQNDLIFMAEVMDEATSVRHHKKKIAFLFSAMRHFAEALREDGYTVDYLALDAKDNPGDFGSALKQAVERHSPSCVVMTEPSEWRVLEAAQDWREELDVDLDIRADDRFLASHEDFVSWATDKDGATSEWSASHTVTVTDIQSTASNPVSCGSLGDIDGDGIVTKQDAIDLATQYLLGSLTATSQANGDVNGDGSIDTTDTNLIQDYADGVVSTFPACTQANAELDAIEKGLASVSDAALKILSDLEKLLSR